MTISVELLLQISLIAGTSAALLLNLSIQEPLPEVYQNMKIPRVILPCASKLRSVEGSFVAFRDSAEPEEKQIRISNGGKSGEELHFWVSLQEDLMTHLCTSSIADQNEK